MGYHIIMVYRNVPMWRVWFSSSLLWDGVYKLERFGLEYGIIFQETDQWMTRETGNYHSKIQKNQIGFVLAGLC